MKRAIIAGVLLATSVAPSTARAQSQQTEGFPAAGAPAVVNVTSTGAAPRAALRYMPAAGARQRSDMTMSMSMAMEVGGSSVPAMPMPSIRIGVDCVVTEVAPSGDITYTMAFTGAEIEGGPAPAVAAQFQSMSEALKSIRGSVTISPRGLVRASNLDLGAMVNSPLGQVMGSTTEMLRQASIPLPEEEVGVGARWEVRNTLSAGGVTVFQKTGYEITAYDGKSVTLQTAIEQTAPQQAVTNPALPAGSDVQLERYTGSGSGTMRLTLSELVPTSEATLDNSMAMNVNVGGMAQQMVVTTSMKMAVAPGK